MGTVEFYSNVNGHETHEVHEIPADAPFDDILRLLMGHNTVSVKNDVAPVRFNKQECNESFPPSSKYIDVNDKVLHIDVAACGIKEEDVNVTVDDNYIIITFNKDKEALKSRIYSQKGLRLITKDELRFKFNPMYHDPNTLSGTLEAGILSLEMKPRAELKPLKKTVFGKLDLSKKDETSKDKE